MSPRPVTRVVLVGFMGAGKTSVGRTLAERLGWRFVDVDDAIEDEACSTVPEIFERLGEARFREMEERAAAAALRNEEVVVASGGGWAVRPGRLAELPPGTISIWLDVDAEEAVRRASGEPGARPLLEGNDPLRAARELLGRRREHYAAATWRVDTAGRSVDDVTARILKLLATHGMEANAE